MGTVSETDVDIVITYVDGNDPAWQAKRGMYTVNKDADAAPKRYRDWENLKYVFRSIDKYMPWVRKVYLVTDNQAPKWLDASCDKLVLVNHQDYIPQEYLPTFNSLVIENFFHKLPGISENFIAFNDDMFVLRNLKKEHFFKNGKPCGIFMEYPVGCNGSSDIFPHIMVHHNNILGKYFKRSEYKKRLRKKILSPKYGMYFFYNLIMYILPFPNFFGMHVPHFPQPYTLDAYRKIWELEPEEMINTAKHRFRSREDVIMYIFYLYQILSGEFEPANMMGMGKMVLCGKYNTRDICRMIENRSTSMLCLNDECDEENFEAIKNAINKSFDKIFPEKSVFEI